MRIGITGSNGLIGWHQRAYFKAIQTPHEIRLANRSTFDNHASLQEFASGLDTIIHFAGVNRDSDDVVEKINISLAKRLTVACEETQSTPTLVFANSTHYDRDTAYGRGKRVAAETLENWAHKNNTGFVNLILPHVFGEFGKPFYNSVVSTFCHQLAQRETPEIIVDGELELVHAQDVAAFCLNAIEEKRSGKIRLDGTKICVSALLETLRNMLACYQSGVFPTLASNFEISLFNTLRSYLFPNHYPAKLTLHSDNRGSLFEVVKSLGGGQVFLSTTRPGITRGNHFHTKKVERFLVAGGEATIRLRKLFQNNIVSFSVRGNEPCYIDIPTFYTHDITNTGTSDLLTLFWANEIFDPKHPDTISEPVDSICAKK